MIVVILLLVSVTFTQKKTVNHIDSVTKPKYYPWKIMLGSSHLMPGGSLPNMDISINFISQHNQTILGYGYRPSISIGGLVYFNQEYDSNRKLYEDEASLFVTFNLNNDFTLDRVQASTYLGGGLSKYYIIQEKVFPNYSFSEKKVVLG